eukprot:TRINITY_DN19200_c0_g2_i2.p1 TRINITY_DN19200_c0_g2~~TRINITY_DN19200_c0_g2_i2.p1  ORF type:complete len:508 (+),score=159.14 TRINITY_DN19200_c0_g2_i2:57-1526(+)
MAVGSIKQRRFDPLTAARRRRQKSKVRPAPVSAKKAVGLPAPLSPAEAEELLQGPVKLPYWVLTELRKVSIFPEPSDLPSYKKGASSAHLALRSGLQQRSATDGSAESARLRLLDSLRSRHLSPCEKEFGLQCSYMSALMQKSCTGPAAKPSRSRSVTRVDDAAGQHTVSPVSLLWLRAVPVLSSARDAASPTAEPRGRFAATMLQRVTLRVEAHLRHVPAEDVPLVHRQITDLSRAVDVSAMAVGDAAVAAVEPLTPARARTTAWAAGAGAWWTRHFGASCYAPRDELMKRFLHHVGCWLPAAAAGDPEHSLFAAMSYSGLGSHVSSHDFALFVGAFGPLRAPKAAPSHHLLSCLFEVLDQSLMNTRANRSTAEAALRGRPIGSHLVHYTAVPAELGLAVVARGGVVQHATVTRVGMTRWRCHDRSGRPLAAAGRTILEAVELTEPICLPHLRSGEKFTLWGEADEAEQLRQHSDVLRAISSIAFKGM